MTKSLELRTKRAKAWDAAKAFLDSRRDANGTVSAEDAATYDKMEAEVVALGHEIERLERQEALDREMAQPMNEPMVNKPNAPTNEPKTGRASEAYRLAMLNAFRTNFRQISNVMEEGTDANGGYLVPEEYDRRLIETLNQENIMRNVATIIKTSGEHKINIAATKPAAAWIDEGGALQFSDATFSQINMDAHKLHVAVKVTEELLYDNAFGLENYLMRQFGIALANAEEDAFLTGNGTGKPLGLLANQVDGHDVGAQVAFTAAKTNELSADEIINLVYALKRPYRKKAKFILNDSTIASIRKLKDGNGAYMWQPSMKEGEGDRLFGYEILTSQYMPTLAAGNKAIVFGDLSYYNIGDRGTRSFAQLKELYAGNGMVGFVAKERVDGRLILPEAVQCVQMHA